MKLFDKLYNALSVDALAHRMRSIRENSPYHREENVWEHTRMVLDAYKKFYAPRRSMKMQLLTLTALLFHDTGKPRARQEKFSEERGHYQTFGGHALISARVFEDFMMSRPELMAVLRFDANEWRTIKWLIENHLPYDIKDQQKRQALMTDCLAHGADTLTMFYDVLRSDALGRISDDHAGKLAKVDAWISQFSLVQSLQKTDFHLPQKPDHKVAMFMVGPSGSGKSTFARGMIDSGMKPFEPDSLRMEFYFTSGFASSDNEKRDYAVAWNYCCIEKPQDFDKFWRARFVKLLNDGHDVVIDSVNSTRKSRAFYIAELRKRGYFIISCEFPVALSTVLERQLSRLDKEVPVDTVTKQYFTVTQPRVGSEVDVAYVMWNHDLRSTAATHYNVVYNN
ncbi:MAG: AAA family ATPase [Candidatus Nitrosotenuis sp.]